MELDDVRIAELVECLARHGIDVNTDELPLGDANLLLDRIISACRVAEQGEQHYQEPQPENSPVLMSHGVIPMMGHKLTVRRRMTTKEAVDAFFDMLPGRGKGGKGA